MLSVRPVVERVCTKLLGGSHERPGVVGPRGALRVNRRAVERRRRQLLVMCLIRICGDREARRLQGAGRQGGSDVAQRLLEVSRRRLGKVGYGHGGRLPWTGQVRPGGERGSDLSVLALELLLGGGGGSFL